MRLNTTFGIALGFSIGYLMVVAITVCVMAPYLVLTYLVLMLQGAFALGMNVLSLVSIAGTVGEA